MNFATALLAGGRSTRMGRDKALLDWNGAPLWQRQLRTLKQLRPALSLISVRGDSTLLRDDESDIVFDSPGLGEGPLVGIYLCLKRAEMPLLALAVDMPHMTAEFLQRRLLGAFDGTRGVVFRGPHGYEPLAAIYTPSMLPVMNALLKTAQYRVQDAIEHLVKRDEMRVLELTADDAPYFNNVNTPQDLPPQEDRYAAAVEHTRLHREGGFETVQDVTAREEPLEIRVGDHSVAVVMRTPGHDRELAAGFLVSEGVVNRTAQIIDIIKCEGKGRSKGNIVNALLADTEVDLSSLTRHVFSTSSCGLCGKTSIESVFQRFPQVQGEWTVSPDMLWNLPPKVRAAQDTFAKTGGLHACAIFDLEGNLVVLREDVGRHNALDKVLGYGLLHDLLPFDKHVLFLSGRVSFEMMQKALAAGVPLVAAISAPSSLAVDFAVESQQTLVGFLRERSMNVYAHEHRVRR